MTKAEIDAYNQGVNDVLTLAARSAEALKLSTRPLYIGFATEALRALAEEGKGLLKQPDDTAAYSIDSPASLLSRGGAALIVAAE